MVVFEALLFTTSLITFLTDLFSTLVTITSLVYFALAGVILGLFEICIINMKEQQVISTGSDIKNYHNLFQVELYVVVMLHELEHLATNEDYGQEKHIHAVISRHMEECTNEACPCKNYEPEYDKKFTTAGSKRLTKSFSAGGTLGNLGSV
jgi:hypothetical protein